MTTNFRLLIKPGYSFDLCCDPFHEGDDESKRLSGKEVFLNNSKRPRIKTICRTCFDRRVSKSFAWMDDD